MSSLLPLIGSGLIILTFGFVLTFWLRGVARLLSKKPISDNNYMETRWLSQYYNAITESDGSFRDVNFRPATAAAAKSIFGLFSTLFVLRDAHDEDGNELLDTATINSRVENKRTGGIHSCWIGEKKWISQIQIQMDWDVAGYECEISFFPADIDKSIFTIHIFTEFLANLLNIADTREYYVRYENAGWVFGDYSKKSGIIFSHKSVNI